MFLSWFWTVPSSYWNNNHRPVNILTEKIAAITLSIMGTFTNLSLFSTGKLQTIRQKVLYFSALGLFYSSKSRKTLNNQIKTLLSLHSNEQITLILNTYIQVI